MFRCGFVVLLLGCGPSGIPIRLGDPAEIETSNRRGAVGHCTPSRHVVVTSATGAPVAGALVVVRQLDHTSCPSMPPTTQLYTTATVRTDRRGRATTCDPETFRSPDRSMICPARRDPATIEIVAGDQRATRTAPFASEVHAVLQEPGELPAEVKALVSRWETCWHWSGEEPYDDARAQQIREGVEASCPGNDDERARLRVKYQSRPDVQDALRTLDEMR